MLNILIILALVFFVFINGIYAGAETGMYQMSKVRLRLGVEKRRFLYRILNKSISDSSTILISVLLGTNLACYAFTSLLTIFLTGLLAERSGVEVAAALIGTPVIFVFAELIPKNIFYYRADVLLPAVAPLLYLSNKVFTFCGAVGLLKFINRSVSSLFGEALSAKATIGAGRQPHMWAIIQESREEGFLSAVQTEILTRLTTISRLNLRAVMVAMADVEMVRVDTDRKSLLGKLRKSAFSRLLVYRGVRADVIGYINVYEVLTSGREFDELGEFVKPIRRLAAETTVSDAINIMQNENEKIVLVTRAVYGKQRPLGIVTMKDLVEELVGELTEW